MTTEVSIRRQNKPEVGIRRMLAYTPQYTPGPHVYLLQSQEQIKLVNNIVQYDLLQSWFSGCSLGGGGEIEHVQSRPICTLHDRTFWFKFCAIVLALFELYSTCLLKDASHLRTKVCTAEKNHFNFSLFLEQDRSKCIM